jgi:hypothetical protein
LRFQGEDGALILVSQAGINSFRLGEFRARERRLAFLRIQLRLNVVSLRALRMIFENLIHHLLRLIETARFRGFINLMNRWICRRIGQHRRAERHRQCQRRRDKSSSQHISHNRPPDGQIDRQVIRYGRLGEVQQTLPYAGPRGRAPGALGCAPRSAPPPLRAPS